MLLEAIATDTGLAAISLPLVEDANNLWRSDWSVLLPMLLDKTVPVSQRARCFHESMALALLEQAKQIRKQYGDFCVGLCGGVFQNCLLTEQIIGLLQSEGFRYTIPRQVPVNDAGLCYGQVIEAMAPAI
jgi:hydrogenase maturation protein HypF